MGKKSPRPLPRGGDAAVQSETGVSTVMRLLSGSAPGNVNKGCPASSGDWGGDVDCPFIVISSGRSAKDRRDGDEGTEELPKNSSSSWRSDRIRGIGEDGTTSGSRVPESREE